MHDRCGCWRRHPGQETNRMADQQPDFGTSSDNIPMRRQTQTRKPDRTCPERDAGVPGPAMCSDRRRYLRPPGRAWSRALGRAWQRAFSLPDHSHRAG